MELLFVALAVVITHIRLQHYFNASLLDGVISVQGVAGWLGGENLWDRFNREK